MQINKPKRNRKSRSTSSSEKSSARRAYLQRDRFKRPNKNEEPSSKPVKPEVSKEDGLIDLYEDPFKKTREEDEQLIINIDFSKPLDILGKIYRQIVELLRVAQSKITKENANRVKAFVLRDRKTTVISGLVAAFVVFSLGYSLLGPGGDKPTSQVQGESTQEEPQLGTKSKYDLLYPQNRKEEELPVALISPPGSPEAYTYADNVNGVEVQVTQQEIPENLKNNQEEEFRKLALNSAFNTELKDDAYTAYLGTSSDGPQSVIMIKNELLVLLKSKTKLPLEVWSEYLTTLN